MYKAPNHYPKLYTILLGGGRGKHHGERTSEQAKPRSTTMRSPAGEHVRVTSCAVGSSALGTAASSSGRPCARAGARSLQATSPPPPSAVAGAVCWESRTLHRDGQEDKEAVDEYRLVFGLPPTTDEHAAVCSIERYSILVKEEIEKCLDVGMTKEKMFQELRKKGIPLDIAYAVYKELRRQNHGFFKAYYWQIDVNRQTDRFNKLSVLLSEMLKQGKMRNPNMPNHGGVHPAASASGLQTLLRTPQQATFPFSGATRPVAIPDRAQFSDWSHFSKPGSSRGVQDFDSWAPSTHLQVMQHAHHLQQSLPNGAPLCPSVPGLSNATAANCTWHAEQPQPDGELDRLLDSCLPSSLLGEEQLRALHGAERLLGNQIYHTYDDSLEQNI